MNITEKTDSHKDHHCSCCGSHEQENKKSKFIPAIIGAAVFVLAFILEDYRYAPFMFIAAYLLIGFDVLLMTAKNIRRGEIFDENLLMTIATVGAFLIGEYPEGAAVMLFFKVGLFFENLAEQKSKKSISDLMDIRPDYANVKKDGEVVKVNPETLNVGDTIIVLPGEKIPLDGTVIEGFSSLDVSALTGEALPQDVSAGSSVLSGSINKSGLLTIKVRNTFGQSTVSKILELIKNAPMSKSKTEKFITRFAKIYTPIVVAAAFLLCAVPVLIFAGAFETWFYRALIFLVVSCPCALVLSVPLAYFAGIGAASRDGILIKGSANLETLSRASCFVFDKTGTLTRGIFSVSEIIALNGFDKDALLKTAAIAQSHSNHPIAKSIMDFYGSSIDESEISDYKEIAGRGVNVKSGGVNILAGNIDLLKENDIDVYPVENEGTLVYIAADKVFAGAIALADKPKPDAKETIAALKKSFKTTMLTGDIEAVAKKIAGDLGIDEFYAQLLPSQKVQKVCEIREAQKNKGAVIFVGDGINDAPVLASADAGIAMGAMGSDAAIEAADIVLMTDEPSKIIKAVKISKKTKNIVWQNIIFALGAKFIVLVLAALGFASMWAAVFADVGVAFLAASNSLRALRK